MANIPLKLARIISTLFVPPSFNFLTFVYLALILENNLYNQIIVIVVSLIFGIVLPVIVFVRMRSSNKISDIDSSIKEERSIPYLLNIMFCFGALPALIIIEANITIISLWISYIITTILLYSINRKWKISAHAIGISISFAILFFLGSKFIFLVLVLMFLIGWARVRLGIHNLSQVIAGTLLGFISTYLTVIAIINFN